MELALISTFVCSHVLFRMTYLLYIGGVLRRRTFNKRNQSDLSGWEDFREKASFILHLDAEFFAGATILTSCLGQWNCWDLAGIHHGIWLGLGGLFILIGGYAKWDAYRVIGDRGWFWYNFFCSPDDTDYEKRGVYRWFDNPMYGIGYLPLFGLALLLLSGWGVALAAFDWVVIWIFYYLCERPHTEIVLKGEE